jgi:Rieske Fe-S protein
MLSMTTLMAVPTPVRLPRNYDTLRLNVRKQWWLLQGDATYLIVTDDGGLQNYGLNSICTHLGCVVPWNPVSLGGRGGRKRLL